MKRTLIYSFLLLTAHVGFCQTEKTVPPAGHTPGPEIAVGVGYGMGNFAFKMRNPDVFGLPGAELKSFSESLVYTIDYLHPVVPNFVFGPAIAIQSVSANYIVESPSDIYQLDFWRINIGLRAGYFYEPAPWFKFYTGMRCGVTVWHDAPANQLHDHVPPMRPFPSLQFFAGARYFVRRIGFGAELGAGTAPYILQTHVVVRI